MSSPKPALATGCARRSERFRFLMVATIGRLYDMRSRSRDAHAPEVCPSHFKKALPTREAERRQARILETAPAGAAAPSVSSAFARKIRRGLASRRSTAALATQINAMAQSRPCFLGRAASGRYPPPLSQSSEAPRGPVVMPADSIPGPPGSGVTSPARRNRTRPIDRLSPVDDPSKGGMILSNHIGDQCQVYVPHKGTKIDTL